MSEELPPQVELAYETPAPHGNAALLVKLAAIFNLIVAGLDVVYGLIQLGLMGFILYFLSVGVSGGLPGAGGAPAPRMPLTMWTIPIWYLGTAALEFAVAALKITAAVKLLRLKKYPGVWGLVAGIVGCTQLWCSVFCILPMPVGIFTVVVFCLKDVKAYLRRVTGEDGLPTRAFEVGQG